MASLITVLLITCCVLITGLKDVSGEDSQILLKAKDASVFLKRARRAVYEEYLEYQRGTKTRAEFVHEMKEARDWTREAIRKGQTLEEIVEYWEWPGMRHGVPTTSNWWGDVWENIKKMFSCLKDVLVWTIEILKLIKQLEKLISGGLPYLAPSIKTIGTNMNLKGQEIAEIEVNETFAAPVNEIGTLISNAGLVLTSIDGNDECDIASMKFQQSGLMLLGAGRKAIVLANMLSNAGESAQHVTTLLREGEVLCAMSESQVAIAKQTLCVSSTTTTIPTMSSTTTTIPTTCLDMNITFDDNVSDPPLDIPDLVINTDDITASNSSDTIDNLSEFTTSISVPSTFSGFDNNVNDYSIFQDIVNDFVSVSNQFLHSGTVNDGLKECINKTLTQLSAALVDTCESVPKKIICVCKKLQKYVEHGTQSVKYCEQYETFQDVYNHLCIEKTTNQTDLNELSAINVKIIEDLGELYNVAENESLKNDIENAIEKRGINKEILNLKKQYIDASADACKEIAKAESEPSKLIDLYEKLINILEEMKELYDDLIIKGNIIKEIEEWIKRIKCEILKKKLNYLLEHLTDLTENYKTENLEIIIDIQQEIVDSLEEYNRDCVNNALLKTFLEFLIDALKKSIKINKLKKQHADLLIEVDLEDAKVDPDENELIKLYESILDVLKKLKECYTTKALKDKTDKEIRVWTNRKIRVLKSIYFDLIKTPVGKTREEKIARQKKIIEILKKLQECYKNKTIKPNFQGEIDAREKYILQIEYNKLVEEYESLCKKRPQIQANIINKLREIIDLLKKVLKDEKNQEMRKKIQDKIKQAEDEIIERQG